MQDWQLANNRTLRRLAERTAAARWRAPFWFAQLADTQFGFEGSNSHYPDDVRHAQAAVAHINRLQPRFAIVCGDLINYLPELYPQQPESLYAQQVADFKQVFDALSTDVPLICVCGNHDVGNQPTITTLNRWQTNFGDDYFAFYVDGMAGIVLNTNLLADPRAAELQFAQQQQWLEHAIAAAQADHARHIVLFGHHPPFLAHARETDDDPQLGKDEFVEPRSGRTISIPHAYFHLPLERRLALLQLMRRCGSRWFFAGHFHRNCIAHDAEFDITCVTTSAVGRQLGDDDHGLRLVRVDRNRIEHRYYPLSSMPTSLAEALLTTGRG